MLDTSDFFIYNYHFQDQKNGKNQMLQVHLYGLNHDNEPILLRVKEDSFRVWLTLEVKDPKLKEEEVCSFLQKINPTIQFRSPNEKNPIKPFIYFQQSDVKQKLYFYNTDRIRCYRIKFKSLQNRKDFYWKFLKYVQNRPEKNKFKLHEYQATPLLQFLSQYTLPSCGWITVKNMGHEISSRENRYTRFSKEYMVDVKNSNLSMVENQEKYPIPVFKCLSFDFEAYSHVETRIPQAKDARDVIFQIGITTFDHINGTRNLLYTLSQQRISKLRLTDGKTNVDEIKIFGSEQGLLSCFNSFIRNYNPIILMGYNIFGFDIPFLHEKCKMYNINLAGSGMAKDELAEYKEVKWSSAAYRCQHFFYYDFDGRISVDLLPIIRRDAKLSKYNLQTVSTHFLGDEYGKDDMSVKQIFESYRVGFLQGKTELIKKCGRYCIQDARIVLLLFEKLDKLVGLIEMARLCNSNIMDLYVKGEQLKVYSQVYKKCYQEKRLVDSFDNLSYQQKKLFQFENYTGAFVFPPIPGKYSWVIPFDFTSLYPTTIIANNICHSTFVINPKIPNEECHVIRWKADDTQYSYRFKKSPIGVIPSLLKALLEQRTITKRQLKNTTNEFLQKVLDKRQLAYKISANSIYGAMGVQVGFIPFLPGAMCTTAMGRSYITKAADYVSSKFNGHIVYGDSVHRQTIIYIKYSSNEIKLYPIEVYWNFYRKNILPYEQFKSNHNNIHGKQQVIFNSDKYQIMTHEGWSPIKRLIRHYTTKKMYKIYTTSGAIIVTEDHSLLLHHNTMEIKPSALAINEHVLCHIPNQSEILDNLIYQKEDWNCMFRQENGFILYDHDLEEKYISYIYFSYLKAFPNAIFNFFQEDEHSPIHYGIDLENTQTKPKGLVLKVEELGDTTDYVYDIETGSGSFHAGISLIVKNTDSIYVSFRDVEKKAHLVWKKAKEVETHLIEQKLFPKPMKLLFEEKLYREFLILSKKRYMAYTCNQDGSLDEKLCIRGVLLARRDNCFWVRELYEKVVRLIMDNRNFETVLGLINQEVLSLLYWTNGKSSMKLQDDIHKFTITKLFNEGYKIRELPKEVEKLKKRLKDLDIHCAITQKMIDSIPVYNSQMKKGKAGNNSVLSQYMEKSLPAHAQLANKMERRGLPVATGSRIEYVVCTDDQDPDSKLYKKLEDPDYYLAFCDILRLDRLHYVKSIVASLDQLLNIVYIKECPRKCTCYMKQKVKLTDYTKKKKRTCLIDPIPLGLDMIYIMVRSRCSCEQKCPCRKNIYNPVETIYKHHLHHFKVMKEIKKITQRKSYCKRDK